MFLDADLIGLFVAGLTAATLLPGGSEIVLVTLQSLSNHSNWILLFVASLGNVLGSVINYWLGRAALSFQHHRLFPVSPSQLSKAQIWFERWGKWSLLLAWAPIIGDPITVAAGVMRSSFLQFCILVTISKVVRYMAVLGIVEQFLS